MTYFSFSFYVCAILHYFSRKNTSLHLSRNTRQIPNSIFGIKCEKRRKIPHSEIKWGNKKKIAVNIKPFPKNRAERISMLHKYHKNETIYGKWNNSLTIKIKINILLFALNSTLRNFHCRRIRENIIHPVEKVCRSKKVSMSLTLEYSLNNKQWHIIM